jgi:hypothetical protein
MDRRDFLATSGRIFLVAASAPVTATAAALGRESVAFDAGAENRVVRIIQTYDAQGNHRTATPGDIAAGKWLRAEFQRLGVKPQSEDFALDRVEPISAYLRTPQGRIDGVPVFDAAFTDAKGISGRLGFLGDDAAIAVVESDPYVLLEPQREQLSQVAETRRSKHKAAVVLTRGTVPGLYLLNAISFFKPSGPPMLQVSGGESERLKALAKEGAEVVLVANARRVPAKASNITAVVAGTNSELGPIVVSTPRSGWWECAGERGGGIACLLEVMRTVAKSKPNRDVLFVAFSGHEVGFIGIEDYVLRRPGIYGRAHAWVHLGANIGVPHQPNLVTASDASLTEWLAKAFAAQGLRIDNGAGPEARVRGEAGAIRRGRARYLTIVCGTNFFHHPADRWPEAVDVGILAAYAGALADGVAELAKR